MLWTTAAIAACGRVNFEPFELVGRAVVPPTLDLEARCGATEGATGELEIQNVGDLDLEVLSATVDGGFAVLTPLPLTLAPGTGTKLEVRAPAAVIGTDQPGGIKAGVLTLVTSEAAYEVDVSATIRGAELAVTNVEGNPLVLDLEGTSGACPSPRLVRLSNTGSGDAQITFTAASGFALGGFSGGPLGASASSTFTVRPATTGACSGAGTISYVATGEVCSTTPTVLQATFVITGSSSCLCS